MKQDVPILNEDSAMVRQHTNFALLVEYGGRPGTECRGSLEGGGARPRRRCDDGILVELLVIRRLSLQSLGVAVLI